MVVMTPKVWDGMLKHAYRCAPLECCGLLVGKSSRIDELVPCTNDDHSATSFSIPPIELLDSFRKMRENDRELVGIYHSHPLGPEHPSRRDVEQFEYPGVSYWIISLKSPLPVVRCYCWNGEDFDEALYDIADSVSTEMKGVSRPEQGTVRGGSA